MVKELLVNRCACTKVQGKPFWGFALVPSHSIVEPEVAYDPQPTLGHLRLQVFSNLLYGAQAIQYFNFLGIVDPKTCEKKPAYDLIKVVNSEIRAYEHVFAGCDVKGVWHIGESIPPRTQRLTEMPHKKVQTLQCSGAGAVISLIENAGKVYLAVQNRDFENDALLDITFSSSVKYIAPAGEVRYDGSPITLQPGDISVFSL